MDRVPCGAGARLAEAAAIVAGAGALAEVKAFLRVEGDAEDEAIARLIAAAIGHGEAFTGRIFLVRAVWETLPARACWQRLVATPVRGIVSVEGLDAAGGAVALPVGASAIDVDAGGDGWVRVTGVTGRVRVHAQAGIAADWSALPEPLRQGCVRLAAHLFTHRDAADEGAPPAAVAALWRPWRRIRLL